ncbi:polarity establishment/cellular polarization [Neonectria punicea]|uniref:Polarity establishment/cellular polarization n=1 Tax=Neonectria punicea TaxID=979145 RepID=A0ABR1H5Z7_9HYPO
MAPLAILFVALHLVHLAIGEPTVNFPLNSQLPPVARLDEPFSYTFSPYTFKSDSKISYSLGDGPKWLSIDSKDGRLYGTPTDKNTPSGDVIGQEVEIVAEDATGSTSLNATLVISRNKAPSINVPLEDQIENLGDYSAPSSLLLYPSKEFSFSFDSDTFSYEPNMVNYYASSDDSSPLPSWVKFSSESLSFTGKTPPFESLIQPPQTFGFKIIASDIVGFSAVSIPFSIIVGSHKLSSDNPIIMLNTTRGKKVTYDKLLGDMKLDKEAARPSEVEISTEGMPDWLSLDNQTWRIEGTPKRTEDHSTNFTINFRDSHQDTLSVMAIVNVATRLFRSTFDDISIRAGEDVSIDLEPFFWDPSEVDIKMTVNPRKDWLKLDGFNITGTVPSSATGKLAISITASSKTSDVEETETLNVRLLASTSTTSSASKTSSSATSTSTKTTQSSEPTSSDERVPSDSHNGVSTTTVLLATILPILFVAILVMLLVCCFTRRRKSKRNYLSSDFRNKISGPVLESLRVNGSHHSIRDSETSENDVPAETLLYRPAREPDSETESLNAPRSSPSLDILATPEVPARFRAENPARPVTRAGSVPATVTETEGRQSWYTVATATATATARQSQSSAKSQASDTTFSESTHQLLPPPAFLSESGSSFRTGLDLTIPSIDDLPHMRHSEVGAMRAELNQPRDPSAFYSSAPESSLAFSSSHQSSPRLMTGLFSKRPSDVSMGKRPATADGTTLLEEATESVPEMRRPDVARLASQQWLNRQHSSRGAWYDTEGSSMSRRSLRSDPSFGSMENWRVVGRRRGNTELSYRELVDEAPFHPSRPGTSTSGREGAQPGERTSMEELMSPTEWGDARASIRGSITSQQVDMPKPLSRHSRRSEVLLGKAGSSRGSRLGERASPRWKREDSRKVSESGSVKAFL